MAPAEEIYVWKKKKIAFWGCFLWASPMGHNYTTLLIHFEEDLLSFNGSLCLSTSFMSVNVSLVSFIGSLVFGLLCSICFGDQACHGRSRRMNHLLSDFSSRCQSYMTISRHINVTMQNHQTLFQYLICG